MATAVKGDREGKQAAVDRALDQAFFDRVSRCFDSLCTNFEDEQAVRLFVQRFKTATDQWNAARHAIVQEYPVGLAATQLPAED